MKAIIQRIHKARLTVNDVEISSCGEGYLVLVGFTQGDTTKNCDYIVNRIINMRIFRDDDGKLNKSLLDVNGEVMIVSNFTLYGDPTTNRRPDFSKALKYDEAKPLYDYAYNLFVEKLGKAAHGVFGEHMHIEMVNDGPLTIIMEK